MSDDPRLGKPSASKFSIIVPCPGQPAMVAAGPLQEPVDDEDAASGTRIHTALQTGNTLELSEEETERYNAAVKYDAQLLNQWRDDFDMEASYEGERELRLWLHNDRMNPALSGQLDRHYVSIDKRYALVPDFKTGWSTYLDPAEKNWQLRVQAVLLWVEIPSLEVIRCALNKPMMRGRGAVDVVDYGIRDLQNSLDSIRYHIWQSEQPDAPRRAGGHCNYCPAKFRCPEAGAYAMLPTVIVNPLAAVATMAPEALLKIWDASAIIEKILDAVKLRLKSMTDDERRALGIEFAKPKNLDPIVDVPGAIAKLKGQGFSVPDILNCASLSKSDLVKLLAKEFNTSTEKATAWMKRELAEFIQEKQSQPALRRIAE